MSKLPSMTVRNAIAFVDAYGDFFSHMHFTVRMDAERVGVQFNNHDADRRTTGRFYYVTDEARTVAATGTLAPCLAYAKENGFTIDRGGRRRARGPKPGFIKLINRDTGEEAFISQGRRVYRPVRNSDGTFGWSTELAFEGKPSKLEPAK